MNSTVRMRHHLTYWSQKLGDPFGRDIMPKTKLENKFWAHISLTRRSDPTESTITSFLRHGGCPCRRNQLRQVDVRIFSGLRFTGGGQFWPFKQRKHVVLTTTLPRVHVTSARVLKLWHENVQAWRPSAIQTHCSSLVRNIFQYFHNCNSAQQKQLCRRRLATQSDFKHCSNSVEKHRHTTYSTDTIIPYILHL